MKDGSERPVRVLSVDDDQRLQDVVREFLENFGYEVFSLESGRKLMETLESIQPDIVLLDVMMPGDDGFTVLREMRGYSRVPVIMLTACGDDTDRITGLEIGADDYLPKPFNPRELLARIKAVLRRMPQSGENNSVATSVPNSSNTLNVSGYTLDSKSQSLIKNGKRVDLSTTEYRIIFTFMNHAGEVLSRDRILSMVFGEDHYVCDRNIDVYISRIRAILKQLGENETRIRTVWGSGYSWVKEV